MLVQKYRSQHGDGEDKEIRAEIARVIDASPTLRNKKDLVEAFVDFVSVDGAIDEEWQSFIAAKCEAEVEAIIENERLRADATRAFIEIAPVMVRSVQPGPQSRRCFHPPRGSLSTAVTAKRSSA